MRAAAIPRVVRDDIVAVPAVPGIATPDSAPSLCPSGYNPGALYPSTPLPRAMLSLPGPVRTKKPRHGNVTEHSITMYMHGRITSYRPSYRSTTNSQRCEPIALWVPSPPFWRAMLGKRDGSAALHTTVISSRTRRIRQTGGHPFPSHALLSLQRHTPCSTRCVCRPCSYSSCSESLPCPHGLSSANAAEHAARPPRTHGSDAPPRA